MKKWILIKNKYLVVFFLVGITFFAYGFALHGPFIFDDFPTFVHNKKFHANDLSFDSIFQVINSSKTGFTSRPIALFSFFLNYHFFGLDPFSYKLVNIFIHLINAFLIFNVLNIFFDVYQSLYLEKFSSKKASAIISAVWLLHPLNLTSILYVVQRMASLSCTFMFASLLAYLLIRKNQIKGNLFSARYYFLLVCSLLAGFYTKENSVVVLGIIFSMELVVFSGMAKEVSERKNIKLFINFGWLCFLVLVIGIFLNWNWFEIGYLKRGFTLLERQLTEARVLWFYVRLILIPDITKMNIFHDEYVLSKSIFYPITTAFSIFFWLALVFFSWTKRKNNPLIFFGLLWFLIGHSIESTLIALELVHEHRNYFPMLGVFICVFGFFLYLKKKIPSLDKYIFLIYVFMSFLFTGTYLRAQNWKDMHSLTQSEVVKNPNSTRSQVTAAFWYGFLLEQEDDKDEKSINYINAKKYLENAYLMNKNDLTGLFGLIRLNDQINKVPEKIWIDELEARLLNTNIDSENLVSLDNFLKCNLDKVCKTDFNVIKKLFFSIEKNEKLIDLYKSYFFYQKANFLMDHNFYDDAVFYFRKSLINNMGGNSRVLSVANSLSEIGYEYYAIQLINNMVFNKLNNEEKKIYLQLKIKLKIADD